MQEHKQLDRTQSLLLGDKLFHITIERNQSSSWEVSFIKSTNEQSMTITCALRLVIIQSRGIFNLQIAYVCVFKKLEQQDENEIHSS